MKTTALITGINGQDGSYLAELLLDKGYEVWGTVKRNSVSETQSTRIEHLRPLDNFNLEYADLTDMASLVRILNKIQPDEIYNLAAQSHVRISFDQPIYTANVTGLGTLNLLEAVRMVSPNSKIYQASSSEMFGNNIDEDGYQRETTPMNPVSPYGCAKVFSYNITRNYRNSYNMKIWNGILFNHESPRRGTNFVTNKVVKAAVRIKLGLQDKLHLGNLDATRDWGHAKDYCIDLDSKILTNEGFKRREDINIGDIVINYNLETNNWEEDVIDKIYDVEHEGEMFTFIGNGFEFRCSPNHRMLYQHKTKNSNNWGNGWKEISAKDMYDKLSDLKLRSKYDYRFPGFVGIHRNEYDISDDMLTLIGYLVTEGCLSKSKKIGSGLQLSVSQSEKKYLEILLNVINNLGLKYNRKVRDDGVNEFIFHAESRDIILDYFDSFDIHRLPNFIYKLSKRQSLLLYETMMNCDGCWSNMTYVSKRFSLVKQFSDLVNICGFRNKIKKRRSGIYDVIVFSKTKKSVHQYITDVKKEMVSENIWCVETKNNGTIITEKNNTKFISGNCKAMWLMLQSDNPDDYVCATGISHSVRDLCEYTFKYLGLNYEDYVVIDDKHFRPEELHDLKGDSTKLRKELNWEPKYTFESMLDEMISYWLDYYNKN